MNFQKNNLRKKLAPQDLHRLIRSLGVTDVQVRWNPGLSRYQVWQVRTAPVLVPGKPKGNGVLMWTIEEPKDGKFREPMVMDYVRMARSLRNWKLLQKLGPQEYANRMDTRDKLRENQVSPKSEDRIRQGAKELAYREYKDPTQVHFRRPK